MIKRPRRGQILIARGATPGIKKNQICLDAIFDGAAENCPPERPPDHIRAGTVWYARPTECRSGGGR